MNCRTFAKKLYDYQDGTLEAADKAEFELHRSDCPRCAALVEAESRNAEVFRAVVQDTCRGLEFIPSPNRPARVRRSIAGWRIAATVAALLLVALLVRPMILSEIGRKAAEPKAEQAAAEPMKNWVEEIEVNYESGFVAETTLVSHESGATSIIEIQVSFHP